MCKRALPRTSTLARKKEKGNWREKDEGEKDFKAFRLARVELNLSSNGGGTLKAPCFDRLQLDLLILATYLPR